MSSTGIGTGSFSLNLLFSSLAMIRTTMETTLTSRVGRWVLGSCIHTSTSVYTQREHMVCLQDSQNCQVTRSINFIYVAIWRWISEYLHTPVQTAHWIVSKTLPRCSLTEPLLRERKPLWCTLLLMALRGTYPQTQTAPNPGSPEGVRKKHFHYECNYTRCLDISSNLLFYNCVPEPELVHLIL